MQIIDAIATEGLTGKSGNGNGYHGSHSGDCGQTSGLWFHGFPQIAAGGGGFAVQIPVLPTSRSVRTAFDTMVTV